MPTVWRDRKLEFFLKDVEIVEIHQKREVWRSRDRSKKESWQREHIVDVHPPPLPSPPPPPPPVPSPPPPPPHQVGVEENVRIHHLTIIGSLSVSE